jgi:hypothetical protein
VYTPPLTLTLTSTPGGRLYVYEFLFAVGNMLVAGLALTYFVVLTPLTGYALPLPQYRRSRRLAG